MGAVMTGAVAMAAGILEAHILQDLRLHLDVQLFGDGFTHAVHLSAAAGTGLLILRDIVFDTLARQIFRQGLATTLLAFSLGMRWQTGIRQWRGHIGIIILKTNIPFCPRNLLGLIEDAVLALLAAWGKPMQPCKRQFLFKLEDTIVQMLVLCRERRDLRSSLSQLRQ